MAYRTDFGRWLFLLGALCFIASPRVSHGQIPLMEAEQRAFKEAAAYAESSVVQIESFGGADVVAGEQVPAGAASGTIVDAGWCRDEHLPFSESTSGHHGGLR